MRPSADEAAVSLTPLASAVLAVASLKFPGVVLPPSFRCHTPAKPSATSHTYFVSLASLAAGSAQLILIMVTAPPLTLTFTQSAASLAAGSQDSMA